MSLSEHILTCFSSCYTRGGIGIGEWDVTKWHQYNPRCSKCMDYVPADYRFSMFVCNLTCFILQTSVYNFLYPLKLTARRSPLKNDAWKTILSF